MLRPIQIQGAASLVENPCKMIYHPRNLHIPSKSNITLLHKEKVPFPIDRNIVFPFNSLVTWKDRFSTPKNIRSFDPYQFWYMLFFVVKRLIMCRLSCNFYSIYTYMCIYIYIYIIYIYLYLCANNIDSFTAYPHALTQPFFFLTLPTPMSSNATGKVWFTVVRCLTSSAANRCGSTKDHGLYL